MNEYQVVTKSQRKWLRNIVLILIIGTILTLGNRTWLGLSLGGLTSYVNLLQLQRQVKQLGDVALGYKRFATAGTIFRIGSALLVVGGVYYFDINVNIYALVIGLMLKYVVILAESFIDVRKR